MDDLSFWLELARRSAGPVLELGCGTGRVTMALAKLGLQVIGLDIDFSMLSVLKEQTRYGRENLGILQSDLTKFRLALSFALVIMPCNTISTLSPAERIAALGCVRRHLLPGGVFAVSLPNPMLLSSLPRQSGAQIEEIFPHPQSGHPVQVSSSWKRGAHHFTLRWSYDHLLPDGRVERLITQIRHHMASIETLLSEFHQAGLQINALLGDYDNSDLEHDSPHLIICAGLSQF